MRSPGTPAGEQVKAYNTHMLIQQHFSESGFRSIHSRWLAERWASMRFFGVR